MKNQKIRIVWNMRFDYKPLIDQSAAEIGDTA